MVFVVLRSGRAGIGAGLYGVMYMYRVWMKGSIEERDEREGMCFPGRCSLVGSKRVGPASRIPKRQISSLDRRRSNDGRRRLSEP